MKQRVSGKDKKRFFSEQIQCSYRTLRLIQNGESETVEFKAGFNKEIDNKVYTLYNLTPDEIAIVEAKA